MLKEILEKILFENPITEMAFDRKTLFEKIRNQADSLGEHILSILVFQTYSDWDQTILDIYDKLVEIIEVKKHRKWLSEKKLFELLFLEPFEGFNIERKAKRLSKNKNMEIKNIPSYKELEVIYKQLVTKMWNLDELDREDIRDIIRN